MTMTGSQKIRAGESFCVAPSSVSAGAPLRRLHRGEQHTTCDHGPLRDQTRSRRRERIALSSGVRRTARENARWGLLRLLQRGGRHDVRAPVRQPARGRRRGGHRAAELCILSGKASRPLPDAARSDPAQPAIAGQLRSGVGLTRIHRLPHRVGDFVREVGGDHGARQHDAARQQRQQAPSGLASRPVGESFGDQLGLSISCAPCPLGSSTHIEPGALREVFSHALRTSFRHFQRYRLCLLALTSGPAQAIQGGALAARNSLAQATVGVGTLLAGSGEISLSRCSGVLVSPDVVLTAAHCVRNNPVASAVVFYEGSRPLRPAIPVAEVTRYDVASTGLPEKYAGILELSLDTAALRLAAPVRGHKPIPIGRGVPPSNLRLAGAGISRQGIGVLKTTRLDPLLVTSTGLLIAATRGSEVCKGDSGGPVVADGRRGPVLWGVASAVLSRDGACGRVVIIAPARVSF